ncbi:MAG: hypothetical protein KF718_07820 [Polyangiaceae bacterium]|nr:hypothetical protein [Polyangiaceae bacterium]
MWYPQTPSGWSGERPVQGVGTSLTQGLHGPPQSDGGGCATGHDARVGSGLPATRRREALLALEYELAHEVEPTLSLERRARTDKSSIRRLALSSADDDAESE